MVDVSANPDEMRNYVLGVRGLRQDSLDAQSALVRVWHDFVSAVPVRFSIGVLPDVMAALDRVADVDDYVEAVAQRFEEAGTAGDDGVYTMPATHLDSIPYTAVYGERRREALRERAIEELARFRENVNTGSPDETTAGELVATLSWMRFEIEKAPDDRKADVASDLIATMGAGDLYESVVLFERVARGMGDLHDEAWPVRGLQDLACLVGWGLDDNPDRAQQWARRVGGLMGLSSQPTMPPGAPAGVEGLALFAAYVPTGTTTVGAAMFETLWKSGPVSSDGPVGQLFDTTSPIQPVLATAAERNPLLANRIVDDLLTNEARGSGPSFDALFSQTRQYDPRHASVDDTVLRDVLTASVDPSLEPTVQGNTAERLAHEFLGHHDSPVMGPGGGDMSHYSDNVIQGFATTTQPLLEGWREEGRIMVPGSNDRVLMTGDDDLWRAVGIYSRSEAGVEGLGHAISGTTSFRLAHAVHSPSQAGSGYEELDPFNQASINELNSMYSEFKGAMDDGRYRQLVDSINLVTKPPSFGADAVDLMVDVAGELVAERNPALGGALPGAWEWAISTDPAAQIGDPGHPTINLYSQVWYEVTMYDLVGHPELATPDVQQAIVDAYQRDGIVGVHRLMTRTDLTGKLYDLQQVVAEQVGAIDPSAAGTGTGRDHEREG